MEQIVYISTARFEPDQQTVDDILASSRRNNQRDGVTGLLIVGRKRFLQVLEGPGHRVQAALERIKADGRHYAIVELSRKRIAAREFASWDMGFVQVDGDSLPAMVDRLTAHLRDPNLSAQFRSFAQMQDRAA